MQKEERRSFKDIYPFVQGWEQISRRDKPAGPALEITPPNLRLISSFQSLSQAASTILIFVGSFVLLAGILNSSTLRSLVPALAVLKASTALAFLLAGVSLRLWQKEPSDVRAIRVAQACASLVILLGLLRFAHRVFGWDLYLDQLLSAHGLAGGGAQPLGGMPLASALNFLLVGCALLILNVDTRGGYRPSQFLTLAAAAISVLGLVDYVYNPPSSYTGMTLPGAVLFAVLCVGILLLRPDRGVTSILVSDGFGGITARRLLPTALSITLALGWLRLEGERAGILGAALGTALLVTSIMVVLALLIGWNSRFLDQADAERRQAEQVLRRARDELETRVAERTSELTKANEALRVEVAERKHTQEKLFERENRFRALIENTSDAIALLNPDGKIIYASPSTTRVLGYYSDDFAARNVFEIVHPDDLAGAKNTFADLVKNPGRNAAFLQRLRHKDGSWRWIEGSAANLLAEPGVQAIVGNYRDITERKRTEEMALHLTALVQSSEDAIVGKTLDGTIISWNPGAERLYGYTAAEAIGRPISMLVPPDRPNELPGIFERLKRGERIEHHETVRINKSGEQVQVSLAVSPVKDTTGCIIGASVIAHDVTERHRTEDALQQANAVLTGWLHELEKRTHETTLLNEMGDLLQTCVSAEEAYTVIARFAQQLFPTEAGALCMLNAAQNMVEAAAVWGDSLVGERVFAPEECWALRRGQVHLMEGPTSGLVCRHVGQSAPVSSLCVPMMGQGETLGILHLMSGRGNGDPGNRLTETTQRLAITTAGHIALALANLRLRETLRIQSIRDPLTSLFNRRYMEESLARELRRAARTQRQLGAIMLDLDKFKRFNDTFGHEAGDALLRELGTFLKTRTRREDIACRYGGEEFVLILPEASIDVTRQRAERLREEFKQLNFQHRGQSLGAVTLSAGVAVFPEHGSTVEEIMRAADRALYRAKAEGRDRVVIGEPAD